MIVVVLTRIMCAYRCLFLKCILLCDDLIVVFISYGYENVAFGHV